MNCVKCGREIPEDQAFCEGCLAEMENYPVKPGTAVHIPARPSVEEAPKKPAKKKYVPTAEERLLRARKKLRRTRIFAAVLLLICGALCFLFAQVVLELDVQRLLGQNYHINPNQSPARTETEMTALVTEPTEIETYIPAPAAEDATDVTPEAAPMPAPETEAPATEAPTEPEAQPPTEAPTEAPTEIPTELPTEAATETPPEVPAAATEPDASAAEAPAETVVPVADEPAAEPAEA